MKINSIELTRILTGLKIRIMISRIISFEPGPNNDCTGITLDDGKQYVVKETSDCIARQIDLAEAGKLLK